MTTRSGWTFFSNHAHVLLALAGDGELRMREIAERVGITERAVAQIVADLEAAGAVHRERTGRRNHYNVIADVPLRHPIEGHRTVGDIVSMLSSKKRHEPGA